MSRRFANRCSWVISQILLKKLSPSLAWSWGCNLFDFGDLPFNDVLITNLGEGVSKTTQTFDDDLPNFISMGYRTSASSRTVAIADLSISICIFSGSTLTAIFIRLPIHSYHDTFFSAHTPYFITIGHLQDNPSKARQDKKHLDIDRRFSIE